MLLNRSFADPGEAIQRVIAVLAADQAVGIETPDDHHPGFKETIGRGVASQTINAGRVAFKGVEAELQALPLDGLQINAAVG